MSVEECTVRQARQVASCLGNGAFRLLHNSLPYTLYLKIDLKANVVGYSIK